MEEIEWTPKTRIGGQLERWYLNHSTAGFTGAAFGALSDKPIPNALIPWLRLLS